MKTVTFEPVELVRLVARGGSLLGFAMVLALLSACAYPPAGRAKGALGGASEAAAGAQVWPLIVDTPYCGPVALGRAGNDGNGNPRDRDVNVVELVADGQGWFVLVLQNATGLEVQGLQLELVRREGANDSSASTELLPFFEASFPEREGERPTHTRPESPTYSGRSFLSEDQVHVFSGGVRPSAIVRVFVHIEQSQYAKHVAEPDSAGEPPRGKLVTPEHRRAEEGPLVSPVQVRLRIRWLLCARIQGYGGAKETLLPV